MPQVLIATHNPGKLREIRQIAGEAIAWRSLDDFPNVPEAPEEGATIPENARAKALYYSQHTCLYALADDSGLEVECLHDAPGVNSAYYAGHPRNDAANCSKLVAALRGVPLESRTAWFRCCMAFARAGHVLLESSGSVEGVIVDAPKGANGFGYDPHFFLSACGQTMAELSPDEKNAISHRGQALRMMLSQIDTFFRTLEPWTPARS